MLNATDTQTQQSGSMAVTNDMWMVPAIPGYEQVRDFYKRFGAKMADSTVGLGFDFSKMLSQNPAAGQALERYGWRDAEAQGRAHHAGDAHGNHRQRSTAARCVRGAPAR